MLHMRDCKHSKIISRNNPTGTRGAIKRGPPEMMDCQMRKRKKMDDETSSKVHQGPISSKVAKKVYKMRPNSPRKPTLCSLSVPKRSISYDDITNNARTTKVDFSKSSKKCMSKSLTEDFHKDKLLRRSVGRDHHAYGPDTSKPGLQSTSQMTKFGSDSNGCQEPVLDVQLSPKAIRALKLKKRYANIIVKAEQKTLFDNSKKVDPVKMQKETKKLERRHFVETARIESQLKDAKASQLRATTRKHEREREAARIALEKIRNESEDNFMIQKELEMLIRLPISFSVDRTCGRVKFINPLEQVGLFMKHEDLEDEDVDGDREGEIF